MNLLQQRDLRTLLGNNDKNCSKPPTVASHQYVK